MTPKKKILVIRFNSIGDIILTSPVLERLHQSGHEVHYLCKSSFAEILNYRPDVKKVWSIKRSVDEILPLLKNEAFDIVVDLHNNIRSKRVLTSLRAQSLVLSKPRLKLWLVTQLGIAKSPVKHIVDRFLDVVKPLVPNTLQTQLSYYPNPKSKVLDLPTKYICIAVGAAFATKEIPIELLKETIAGVQTDFVLIGGPNDVDRGTEISKAEKHRVTNFVGQLSISESAQVIERSNVLITGDTGMMHLAAALNKPTISIFGSTHPLLGYTPYYGSQNTKYEIIENSDLGCRPCTKQGKNKCPKGHFKCMLDLDSNQIIEKAKTFI